MNSFFSSANSRVLTRVLPAFLILATLSACTIKYTYLKPDYEQNEKNSLKRIALRVDPNTVSNETIDKLILTVQREYISVKRDYIIYPLPEVGNKEANRSELCKAEPKLNGILVNNIRLLKKDNGEVKLGIQSTLYNCKGDEKVWDTYGESTFESQNPNLNAVITAYSNRIGADIKYLVAPTYELLYEMLDSLPSPILTREEKGEKIDMMTE